MEFVTFIVICINAIFIYLFSDLGFVTSFFTSPFISLILFPITALEIAIIYFLLELSKEPSENKP